MGEERERKRSRRTAENDREGTTNRQLERNASKEAVEEEEKTGGALPRTCSDENKSPEDARDDEE